MIVTTEIVKKCITKNLRTLFSDSDINIYVDTVKQGLSFPCFFVRLLDSDQEKKGYFFHRHYLFTIRYHPDPMNQNIAAELEAIQDIIYESLTRIHYDELVLRCSPKCEIKEDVLHIFCDYKLRLLKHEESIKMNEIDKIEGGIK